MEEVTSQKHCIAHVLVTGHGLTYLMASYIQIHVHVE